MDAIITYEKHILPKYNDELIDIYIKYCRKFAANANNRRLYSELAGKLKHIKNMKNSDEKFISLMIEIKSQYRNKPVMQDELKYL